MFEGLQDAGAVVPRLPELLVHCLRPGRRPAGHRRRRAARPVGHAVHRAPDHAHDQDAAQRRDPDPDLRLRRHALRRQPHAPSCSTSRAPPPTPPPAPTATRSRARARPAARSASRPRALSPARLFGVLCLAHVHAGAGRDRAVLRRLRVLLARALRRRHVGQHRRRRPAQGLAHGLPGPARRPDRAGRPLRVRPLHLRLGRALRRHRADPGADRRLRLRRGADFAGGPDRAQDRRHEATRCCRASARSSSTGAPCCAPA